MNRPEQRLQRRRAQHLLRRRLTLDSPQGPEVVVDGERLLNFSSNDYLGLANHPKVNDALRAGLARYGVGAGASHLVSGHSRAHRLLEEELADFVSAERALLFSSGYLANLGVIAALVGRGHAVYEDKLNHASLIDAARLSQADLKRYPHLALDRLGSLLAAGRSEVLIASDGVFSMDGDLAPVPELLALARKHGARLLIDEAHALGVLGAGGRGSFEYWAVRFEAPAIIMGTLGKAFGCFGAFVAAEDELIELLIQEARTYIYTTALPPALAEAARAALGLARAETWRREHLNALVERFRAGAAGLGLRLSPSATPIQPVIIGENSAVLAAAETLRRRGILVPAIRPPTVPAGTARLRVSLSAAHTPEHIDRLLSALSETSVDRS